MLAGQSPQAWIPAGHRGGIQVKPLDIVRVRVHAQADSTLLAHHVADISRDVGTLVADHAGHVLQRLPTGVVIVLPRPWQGSQPAYLRQDERGSSRPAAIR
jgi:hypothetical protein